MSEQRRYLNAFCDAMPRAQSSVDGTGSDRPIEVLCGFFVAKGRKPSSSDLAETRDRRNWAAARDSGLAWLRFRTGRRRTAKVVSA